MKKTLSLVLSFVLGFIMCFNSSSRAEMIDLPDVEFASIEDFTDMDDPALLQFLEDSIYATLEEEYADADFYFEIEDVSTQFISKEYLDETAYNSKANIFFGYDLVQLNEVFEGNKYIFTLADDGQTGVQEFEEIPYDVYDKVIRNVVIGTGVILICVTIAVASGGIASGAMASAGTSTISGLAGLSTVGAGATKVSLIFTASAKTATLLATQGTVIAGTTTLIKRGIETGWDAEAMIESAAMNASEGYKYGAITGAVTGAAKGIKTVRNITRGKITPRQAEQAALAQYGGREQVSFLNGREVSQYTIGATRPDIIVNNVAIEVKNYNLTNPGSLYTLVNALSKQVSSRIKNLPAGMTQKIVLNVEGRGYTKWFVQKIVEWLQHQLDPIYPNIPIEIMGGML